MEGLYLSFSLIIVGTRDMFSAVVWALDLHAAICSRFKSCSDHFSDLSSVVLISTSIANWFPNAVKFI